MKLKQILLSSITALTVMVRGVNAIAGAPTCPPNPCNCHGGDHGDQRSDAGDDKGDHGDQKPPVDHGDQKAPKDSGDQKAPKDSGDQKK